MRRYLLLFAVTIAASAVLAALARAPRRASPAAAEATAPMSVERSIAIEDGRVSPAVTTAPKGHLIRFTIRNRGRAAARVALSGYEDRLAVPELGPGERWCGELLADRPGEDFAWLVDGRPAGRFAVLGSHLVEGHR